MNEKTAPLSAVHVEPVVSFPPVGSKFIAALSYGREIPITIDRVCGGEMLATVDSRKCGPLGFTPKSWGGYVRSGAVVPAGN